ncbi:PAS domain S-box protein [Myxococcota bacterium]|nr:PAS domain S-box protein [Myxococcota bacterium]
MNRAALRVTLGYVVLAGAWILFSDMLVAALPGSFDRLTINVGKGLFFVLATAALLFWMVRANVRSLTEESDRVRASRDALLAQERQLRTLSDVIEQSTSAVMIADAAFAIVYVNPSFLALSGLTRDEVLGRTPLALAEVLGFEPPPAELLTAIGAGQSWAGTIAVLRRDGDRLWWLAKLTPIHDAAGNRTYTVGYYEDVTAKRATEVALEKAEVLIRRSEREYRTLFESSPLPMWIFDPATLRFLKVNQAALSHYGYNREHVLAMSVLDLHPPAQRDEVRASIQDECRPASARHIVQHVTASGARIDVELSCHDLDFDGRPARLVLVHDVTDRERNEAQLRASLVEKESLLKEIHHRVKNNLQIVSSLLYLQASQTRDAATQAVLLESQGRIRSMAMVHESLYGQSSLARIDLSRHLGNLCNYLFQSYGARLPNVRIAAHAPGIELDLDRAIPLSLLVTELVSNALKYAYPDGRSGAVTVDLSRTDGTLTLTVADDGVGLPAAFDPGTTTSLGLKLVSQLTRQLGGELRVSAGPGARFDVRFPAEERPAPVGGRS